MSAELLREAAAEIRKDWRDEDCSGSARAYNLAVADWLEDIAEEVKYHERGVERGSALQVATEDVARFQPSLVVARAYLGRDS